MERSSDTALLAVEDMSMISVGTVCGKLIGVEIVAHRDFSDLGVRRRLGPFRKGSTVSHKRTKANVSHT